MDHDALEEALTESIYDAAIEPACWQCVAQGLSEAFGNAAVAIALMLRKANPEGLDRYHVHLDDDYTPIFSKHFNDGKLPWGSPREPMAPGRFGLGRELFPDADVPQIDFYHDWMKPQDLAPEGPIAHTIMLDEGLATAGIVIFRRLGGRPFEAADLAFGNRLVPHLRRGYTLGRRHAFTRGRRDALIEVIDRLPQGVILLDSKGRTVSSSRRAEQIASLDDGFEVSEAGVRATHPGDDAKLQGVIERTLKGVACVPRQNVMTISRGSGRPSFGVVVSNLVGEPRRPDDPVIAIFVGDPDAGQISTTEILRSLYNLTHAEAELVQLLAEGASLDEAAKHRGVTRNTARTQLKQVFAKTGTNRQGDLVRIVLSGVASIQEE